MQVPVLQMCDDVFMNEGHRHRSEGIHKGCGHAAWGIQFATGSDE